ncbi:MAG TPA: SGNH/GDSL hydrolase family protein [Panacibacter sp.]|nr:SGNH/GDSL hydrolase family protein [Panacibacter sp.]
MKYFFKIVLLFLLPGFSSQAIFAQDQHPAFWDEIQAFKKQDKIKPPPKNAILFVGSSSFRMWTDVQEAFPGYTIINRGFGGSSLPDVIRYMDDIIIPYKPKQIVIYCGDNDLAANDTVTAQTVADRFKTLITGIRKKLGNVPVAYVSIKPSPSRAMLIPKAMMANQLIENYLKHKNKTAFIDVYHAMVTPDNKPMPDIFKEDNLHMNAKGYAIWQKVIQPYLLN